MSYHSDGYDEGYKDGSFGKEPQTTWPDVFSILDTDSQFEWEQGYNEGYQAGKEEFESSQE